MSTSPTGQPRGGDFHVRMTFGKSGPAIEGTWADGEVALRKFRAFVGTHTAASPG
ncbi:hypothetical protein SUDANB1_00067 [Streptomyces sp. enrichment culture]|uniref:hypothetical protein n=1 Tax=Streptomyces sp. enrichment culture TaxID=1795815 RepID=UPI003F548CED